MENFPLLLATFALPVFMDDLFLEVSMLQKIHKPIKINQNQLNLCFSCKTKAQSHYFREKALIL